MRKIENIKTKLIFLGLLVLFRLTMYALNTTCILKDLLGIPCPGCGMTRALICAVRLNPIGAFTYHPMFWSVPLLALYFLYDGCLFLHKWLNHGTLTSIALGFILNWLIRL